MNELALFAGAGGGILGGHLLGWRTVCAVERDAYAAQVLAQRQNDGILRPFPIWSDVQSFDGRPWAKIVDVISGGFPCQDISATGGGAGIEGKRSGLWSEMARIICEIQPEGVLLENSPMLTSRGLGRVLGDLAEMGFNAQWGVLGAGHIGASHMRERIWIVASNTNKVGFQRSESAWRETARIATQRMAARQIFTRNENDLPSPFVLGARNGMAARMDRTSALGNGQVPAVAATAWQILSADL